MPTSPAWSFWRLSWPMLDRLAGEPDAAAASRVASDARLRTLPGGSRADVIVLLAPDLAHHGFEAIAGLAATLPRDRPFVTLLVQRETPPDVVCRDDGLVRSLICTADIVDALVDADDRLDAGALCFTVLHAALNQRIAVPQLTVRQIPDRAALAFDGSASPSVGEVGVIMAHRGPARYLETALDYLDRLDKAEAAPFHARIGLDVDRPDDYARMADTRPWADLYVVPGAPRGPYVVRQQLVDLSPPDAVLLFQDSDDISCFDRLRLQREALVRQRSDLVGSHAIELDEIGEVVRAFRYPLDIQAALDVKDAGTGCYLQAEPLLHATALVNRRAFLAAGGFSTNRSIANDTQFMLRAFFALRMTNVDEFLYIRRRHPAALTVARATAAGHPMRRALSDLWAADFLEVKRGGKTLSASALAPERTDQDVILEPLRRGANTSSHDEPRGLSRREADDAGPLTWDDDERALASPLIAAIRDRAPLPAFRTTVTLRLSDAEHLKAGLPEPLRYGALLVRHLFHELGLDERALTAWRLDHKLVQALVLARWCPEMVPVTMGLGRALCRCAIDDAKAFLLALPARQLLLKTALGEASGDRPGADVIAAAIEALPSICTGRPPASLSEERFILQQRISIAQEYRVHSLGRAVIPEMTFRRYRPDTTTLDERSAPNAMVASVLARLPDALVSHAMYGWDVARDHDGRWFVIEANPAGVHDGFKAGFQCSGFLQTRGWGPPLSAKLLRFIRERFGAAVAVDVDVHDDRPERETYWWVAKCLDFLDLLDRLSEMPGSRRAAEADVRVPERVAPRLSAEACIFGWALEESRLAITQLDTHAESHDGPRSDPDAQSSLCAVRR